MLAAEANCPPLQACKIKSYQILNLQKASQLPSEIIQIKMHMDQNGSAYFISFSLSLSYFGQNSQKRLSPPKPQIVTLICITQLCQLCLSGRPQWTFPWAQPGAVWEESCRGTQRPISTISALSGGRIQHSAYFFMISEQETFYLPLFFELHENLLGQKVMKYRYV